VEALSKEGATGGVGPADAQTWQRLYRLGGIAGLLALALYAVAVVLAFSTPALPATGGAALLEYVAANRTLYVIKQVLWLTPSLLATLVFLALYVALKDLDRSVAAIGGLIGIAGWAISCAWPTTGEGGPVLVYLSDRYLLASEAQRGAFVAAAEAFSALDNLPSALGVLQTTGVLILSLVMLKGVFPRSLAYLGLVTGGVGVISELLRPVLGIGYVLYGVLIVIWFGVVGWRLYRLGSRSDRLSGQRQAQSP
jgi:hypothetical protein